MALIKCPDCGREVSTLAIPAHSAKSPVIHGLASYMTEAGRLSLSPRNRGIGRRGLL